MWGIGAVVAAPAKYVVLRGFKQNPSFWRL